MMRLPARTSILPAFLLVCASVCSSVTRPPFPDNGQQQTRVANKEIGSTISGKITIKGKPAAGIVVGMRSKGRDENFRSLRATTNDDGIYRIANVSVGSYYLSPAAP